MKKLFFNKRINNYYFFFFLIIFLILFINNSYSYSLWVYEGDDFSYENINYHIRLADNNKLLIDENNNSFIINVGECVAREKNYCLKEYAFDKEDVNHIIYKDGKAYYGYLLEIEDIKPDLDISIDEPSFYEVNSLNKIKLSFTNKNNLDINNIKVKIDYDKEFFKELFLINDKIPILTNNEKKSILINFIPKDYGISKINLIISYNYNNKEYFFNKTIVISLEKPYEISISYPEKVYLEEPFFINLSLYNTKNKLTAEVSLEKNSGLRLLSNSKEQKINVDSSLLKTLSYQLKATSLGEQKVLFKIKLYSDDDVFFEKRDVDINVTLREPEINFILNKEKYYDDDTAVLTIDINKNGRKINKIKINSDIFKSYNANDYKNPIILSSDLKPGFHWVQIEVLYESNGLHKKLTKKKLFYVYKKKRIECSFGTIINNSILLNFNNPFEKNKKVRVLIYDNNSLLLNNSILINSQESNISLPLTINKSSLISILVKEDNNVLCSLKKEFDINNNLVKKSFIKKEKIIRKPKKNFIDKIKSIWLWFVSFL